MGVGCLAAGRVRNHSITLNDYFSLAYISESAISPNGEFVAYAEARWQESTDDRKADVWVVRVADGQPLRLTFDRAGESGLKWSADSSLIYFLGQHKRADAGPPYNGKTQVWRTSPRGGEPLALTRELDDVTAFDISRDGRALYFVTACDDEPDGEWASLRKKFPGPEYGHGRPTVRAVNRLDLNNWRITELAIIPGGVAEIAVAPNGQRLALVTAPTDEVVSYEGRSEISIVDTATGKVSRLPKNVWKTKAPSPYGRLESLAWSGDSRALAFVIAYDGYPSEIIVTQWDDIEPKIFKLRRPDGVSLHASVDQPLRMCWRRGSSELCFLGEEKARVRAYCAAGVSDSGPPRYRCLTPGDVVVDSISFDASGRRAAVQMGDRENTPEIYLVEPEDGPRRLTRVNPQVEMWKIPALSVVSWKGAKGTLVEGVLELPCDARPGEPLPLIVCIHGGPTAASVYELQYTYFGNTLFPSHGYAVLNANYRGSTGYGDQFLTDLIGRSNDIEVEDILKGVDAMIAEGIADRDRLGVTGWSHGGYLTNCLITRTDRFKAASSGAGIADMVLLWGTNDEPGCTAALMKGLPWERCDEYRRASPIYAFGQVRTPTVFHDGARDPRCPQGNSRALFRAMHEHLRVPCELVVYAGEFHGLNGYKNRLAKMTWDLAWFGHFINGKPAPR
jgi:dipeptidyl aminopeptidase/acylaminoacyl peptidase